jgi:XTP/dITP diphosphohydrolase
MQKLLIATQNPGKFREISEVFNGSRIKLIFLGDLGISSDGFFEDGKTFAENAYKKAKFFYDKTGMTTLAEDSGIIVDALSGELGVKTRRWGAGEAASDEEWIKYFLERVKKVSSEKRGAKFVCNACLIDEKRGILEYFCGETVGKISEKLLAPVLPGLPLSSCFVPEGMDKAYAEISAAEKNKISHRGKAIMQVRNFLEKLFNSERKK